MKKKPENQKTPSSHAWWGNTIEQAQNVINSLIDLNPNGITIFDKEGYVVKANTIYNGIFGSPPPEYNILRDENVEQLGLGELRNLAFQGERLQTPPVWYDPGTLEHVQMESKPVFIRANVFPCHDKHGEVSHVVGMFEDLTEIEHHRLEAQKNYELYLDLFENANDYLFTIDFKGQFTKANRAALDDFGYTKEEIPHTNISQLVHPDDLPLAFEMVQRMEKGETSPEPFELRLMTKEGIQKISELKIRAVLSDGEPVEVEGIARDITHRKELEAELIRAKEYTDRLVETANAIIIGVDLQDRVTLFNSLAEKVTGYSKEEVLGQNYISLFSPASLREQMEQDFRNFHQNIPITDLKGRLLTKEGNELILSWNVTSIEDSEGNHTGYISIGKDISDQQKLETQLQQAQKMEALGTLAGGVAHEFNNILGGILGYASYIKTKLPKKHPCYPDVEMIEQSAERAAELTGRLLTLARKEIAKFRSLNLNETIQSVISLLSRTIDKNIAIESTLHPLTKAVRGDEGQLQQAILNLCLNARDAMPSGGTLTIRSQEVNIDQETAKAYHGTKPGQYLRISISDTGIGMDRQTRKRIFEPFFTTKTSGKHTGLGLSMVYGIIHNHEGFINVYSEVGKGTTFNLYLPIIKKAPKKKEVIKEKLPTGTETILVVDDEELILNLAEKLLAAGGYKVKLAGNGEAAIKQYEAEWREIDLVILDMIMPGMGGSRTFEQLKQINPDVRVVLSSGYSKEGDARSVLENGGRDFLQKPFNMEKLLHVVRKILDS